MGSLSAMREFGIARSIMPPQQEILMAKPPPSGPSSDIAGVNRDARVGAPNRKAGKGGAETIDEADKQSKARPKDSGSRSTS